MLDGLLTQLSILMHRVKIKPVRILVIESNNDHWTLIEKAIRKCFIRTGIVSVHVSSEEKALMYLDRCLIEEWNRPSLILLDLYLPSLENGLGLLKQIKTATHSYRAIPIVILSSSNIQADINEAYSSGASSYCLKPTILDDWITLFDSLHEYWLDTVTLLPHRYY